MTSPHNHKLIQTGDVNRTYILIVTNLWERICNFKNIQIIGISSPNAPTIICDLAQDEQVKQQCFKFWSHLTINLKRYVYINVFCFLAYIRLFRYFLFVCLSVCLSVCLIRVIHVRRLVDQSVRVGTTLYKHSFNKETSLLQTGAPENIQCG